MAGANNVYFPAVERTYRVTEENYMLIDNKRTNQLHKITVKDFIAELIDLGLINNTDTNLANTDLVQDPETRTYDAGGQVLRFLDMDVFTLRVLDTFEMVDGADVQFINGDLGAKDLVISGQVEVVETLRHGVINANTGVTYIANCAQSNIFHLTADNNFTLDYTLAKPAWYLFRVEQDGIGGRLITLAPGKFQSPAGAVPVLSLTPGAIDELWGYYDGTRMTLYLERNILTI